MILNYRLTAEEIKVLADEISKNLRSNFQTPLSTQEDPFLTIDEVAKLLNMTKGSIYGLVHKNAIPYHKKGKLYFLKSEINDWIKSGKRETKSSLHEKADEYLAKNLFQ
ncbi:helix-turn-helix domain-containing protein [Cellulophaga baltica]|uniref:helix-turn-helix domain-containing protein n=1 Tax=Cellulophaga baltica TaxID=76594 RepID=UPI000407D0FB|nr:helix-turn-helix domain-containing protein [Cellulophaga baltica]